MITIQDAIITRKSVRSFTKKKVSNKIIKNILEVASRAPSGTNTQPWNVHVLTGKKLNDFTAVSKKEFMTNSESLVLERLNYLKKYREPYLSRRIYPVYHWRDNCQGPLLNNNNIITFCLCTVVNGFFNK